MRALLRICVLAAFVIVPALALASSRVLAPNCNKALYKPGTIIVACGDAYTYVNKLKWSSWTATKAAGKGDYAYNTCTPSCVAGHIKSYRVAAILSDPKTCSKQTHRIFGKLEVTFTGSRPSYVHRAKYKITLHCPF